MREKFLQLLHLGFDSRGRGDGVAAVGEHDGHAHGLLAVQARGRVIALAAQLHAGHVFQIDIGAARGGAQDDVAELLRRAQLPLRRDGGRDGLPGLGRQGADGAGGNLRVLRRNGRRHVQEREVVVLQLFRIDPHAHGALRAEQPRLAHAAHALDFRADVALHVVGDVLGFHHLGVEHEHHQEVGARFGHRDAVLLHRGRQQRRDFRELVLHVHLRQVFVGFGREGQADFAHAIGRSAGAHVVQPLDAVHVALDDGQHAVFQNLRGSARISG